MGVRASVVVCVTSFLLGQFILMTSAVMLISNFPGSLFTHWIADSLTLWKSPVTDEHLWTAALYYSILTRAPAQILYVLFAITILGGTTIFWSFNDLEAGNLMFDGGSICRSLLRSFIQFPYIHIYSLVLYGVSVIMYAYSVIPSQLFGMNIDYWSRC